MLGKEMFGKKTLKKASVALVSLGLVMGTSALDSVSAAPTQKGTLTCRNGGSTTFTSNGAVLAVRVEWYKNSTTYLEGTSWDYTSPWSWATPPSAKTAKATVMWNGNSGSSTTIYSVACR